MVIGGDTLCAGDTLVCPVPSFALVVRCYGMTRMCYTIYRVRLLTDRKRESMMDMEAELASCMPDARLA